MTTPTSDVKLGTVAQWALRGSQLQTQLYVNRRADELSRVVLEALPSLGERWPSIRWVTPLEPGFAEPRDQAFLEALELGELSENLRQFWPKGGPVWDALAICEFDGGGRGYGEVGFKLDPAEPGFVRVDNRFFKRMFGDFRPKQGDLVLAKTGELLGIMVNNDYCALLKDFAVAKSLQPGKDLKAQQTAALFDQLIARLRSLPAKLQ